MEPHHTDPTALTTAHVQREIAMVKEILGIRIKAVEETALAFREDLTRVPTDVQKEIGNVKDLHDRDMVLLQEMFAKVEVKFDGVEQRFQALELLRREGATATATAVAAALQAAKEQAGQQTATFTTTIAKSEAAINKNADATSEILRTSLNALNAQFTDLRDRIIRIEGMGLHDVKENSDINWGRGQGRDDSNAKTWLYFAFGVTVLLALMNIAVSMPLR